MHEHVRHEQQLLERMIGRWNVEFECSSEADSSVQGGESVRRLGDHWIIGEGSVGEGHEAMHSILTIGFDPRRERFVGTFIASVMTNLWVYEGSVDADGRVLTLATEGPHPTEDRLARYEDIFEFVNDDHRTLTSRVLEQDGTWQQVMLANYRRV
ncbi:MAG: DUF1579 domain-containing protein [Maioricimonas sp. JB045]